MVSTLSKHTLRAWLRDQQNRWRHKAPLARYGQTIWVDPAQCQRFLWPEDFRDFFGIRPRASSAQVVDRWPDDRLYPLVSHDKLRYCLRHWRDGMSWFDAGAMTWMLGKIQASGGHYDECSTFADVVRRFESLDSVFEQAQRRGRLATRSELDPHAFREVGGILMHLGPKGEPVFAGAGCHRLAMALMLKRPFPAQLGVVHVDGLPALPALIRPPTLD
jgi:hypothetical protein